MIVGLSPGFVCVRALPKVFSLAGTMHGPHFLQSQRHVREKILRIWFWHGCHALSNTLGSLFLLIAPFGGTICVPPCVLTSPSSTSHPRAHRTRLSSSFCNQLTNQKRYHCYFSLLTTLWLSWLVLFLIARFSLFCLFTMGRSVTFTSARVLVRAPFDGSGCPPTETKQPHSVRGFRLFAVR